MKRRSESAQAPGSAIVSKSLTPLLDTLFLLLFALMALSDVRTSNRAEPVRIHLPEVEPGGDSPSGAERRVVIEVAQDSSVTLPETGAALASRADLDRALAEFLGESLPDQVVVEIHADRQATHGTVLELLQHLRLAGFVDVQILAMGEEGRDGPFGTDAGGAR